MVTRGPDLLFMYRGTEEVLGRKAKYPRIEEHI